MIWAACAAVHPDLARSVPALTFMVNRSPWCGSVRQDRSRDGSGEGRKQGGCPANGRLLFHSLIDGQSGNRRLAGIMASGYSNTALRIIADGLTGDCRAIISATNSS